MPDRIDAYAAALLEIAKAEGSLETVEDELFKVARTLEANDALLMTITDQSIPVERRQGIVEDLFGGKASKITTGLVSFMVGMGRGRDLPAIIDKLVADAAEDRMQTVAEVRTSIPLSPEQRARLAAAQGKATGKQVSLKVIIDPSVLGGIVPRVGDPVIDGSVRHRLEQLRQQF